MAFRPSSVVRAEASIAAPLLHRICQNVFYALVAVQLDDLFYRAVLQMHPVEIFPNEDSDPARAGTVFPEALAPFINLAAFMGFFHTVRIEQNLTLHRRRPHRNREPA